MSSGSSDGPTSTETEPPEVSGAIAVATASSGGIVLVGLDVAYALVANTTAAIDRIYAIKRRSREKPQGMLGSLALSREIHELPGATFDVIASVIDELGCPVSVVAPARFEHPMLVAIEPEALASCRKGDTLDMLLNAGVAHEAIVAGAVAAKVAVFGSSANVSLTGSVYGIDEVPTSIRLACAVEWDTGPSRYANAEGMSSTIIDFANWRVIRRGIRFDQIRAHLTERTGHDVDP